MSSSAYYFSVPHRSVQSFWSFFAVLRKQRRRIKVAEHRYTGMWSIVVIASVDFKISVTILYYGTWTRVVAVDYQCRILGRDFGSKVNQHKNQRSAKIISRFFSSLAIILCMNDSTFSNYCTVFWKSDCRKVLRLCFSRALLPTNWNQNLVLGCYATDKNWVTPTNRTS